MPEFLVHCGGDEVGSVITVSERGDFCLDRKSGVSKYPTLKAAQGSPSGS